MTQMHNSLCADPSALRARLVELRDDALQRLADGLPIIDGGLLALAANAGAVLTQLEAELSEQLQPRSFAKLDKVLGRLGDDINYALMYDSDQRDILNGRLQEAKYILQQIAARDAASA